MSKEGFVNLNSTLGILTKDTITTMPLQEGNNLTAGRVLSVILDDTHPRYLELGGAKAIGAVELIDIQQGSQDYSTVNKSSFQKVAYPLQPGIKNYPLINELVYYISQPSKDISSKTTSTNLYYISIINLWNHPHHNAIPYSAGSTVEQNKGSYQSVSRGVPNNTNTTTGEILLGQYFKERATVNPLRLFEGDLLVEGRFGNSLRLGSTGGTSNWSEVGEQGDPIMILRNGQGEGLEDSWTSTQENINLDAGSMYMTTSQRINLRPASTNSYLSYQDKKPEDIQNYIAPQIILTSGRLVFNSVTDHILLASARTINLNSQEGINFDTTANIILQGGRVNLGSYSAQESVLLGDTLVSQLETLIDILTKLLVASSTAANSGGPVVPLATEAPKLLTQLKALNLQLAKSKRVYTV